MSEPALSIEPILDEAQAPQAESRSRTALLKRLTDVVCLPASRINNFERAMTADLLVEMLPQASVEARARIAKRIATLKSCPAP